MKTLRNVLATLVFVAGAGTGSAQFQTAFTYQGQLAEGGQPAAGFYDFRFALFPTSGGKFPVTDFLTNSAVPVTQGLFTTPLDFGATVFAEPELWLQIAVRTNGHRAFTVQSPRQQITSAPWAIRAAEAERAALASNVAPASVTSAGLAPGSVQTVHVQTGAIGREQLAAGAVGSAQIANAAIQGNHLGSQAVASTHLAPGAVGSNHIAAGAVHAVHLAPDAVFTNGGSGYGLVPPGGIILSASATPPQSGFTLTGAIDSGSGDAWFAGTTTSAPPGAFGPAVVWTGTELLTWSGYLWGGGWSPSGGRYNPTTDSWQPISTTGAPSPRQFPAAVWTGTEMIVWGWKTNDGAIYNLATDSWRPMTMTGAPGLLGALNAVRISSGMMVWGFETWGVPATNYTTRGFLYNLTANTWTPLSTNGAPTKRGNHSYVWTGSELIIWGGDWSSSSFQPVTDSARYRLSDNTWRPVATNGAPSPRGSHTAVWTGTRMVIWGGYGYLPGSTDVGLLNDGASYNPNTDSWIPITQVGAPAPRHSHSAVWNGSKMIVWGGFYQTDAYFSSGGMYDLASDTWLRTAASGAPAGRYDHNAFWSGSRMLIYSGSTGSRFPKEVQSYDPTKGLFYMYRWQ